MALLLWIDRPCLTYSFLDSPNRSASIGTRLSRSGVYGIAPWKLGVTPNDINAGLGLTSKMTARIRTREELLAYADRQEVIVSLTTLGPAYRAVARSKHNETQILGYIEGFIRPTGQLLHLDKMEVFRKMVHRARHENPKFKGGGTVLGVGMLMAYLCVLHGAEEGKCSQAEFLAIDDSQFQHKRLVKLYRNAGFKKVKYVGDDFRDVPDRLVWGGCGTLLRADIQDLLRFWSALMEKSEASK